MRRIVRPEPKVRTSMVECLYCKKTKTLTLEGLQSVPVQYWCHDLCKRKYANHGEQDKNRFKKDKRGHFIRIKFDSRNFYNSRQWRTLRFQAIKTYGNQCMCCGAKPPAVVIHVDHIKPISQYPDRRLDFDNLQILCETCNKGKSNLEQTDFRPKVTNGRPNELL